MFVKIGPTLLPQVFSGRSRPQLVMRRPPGRYRDLGINQMLARVYVEGVRELARRCARCSESRKHLRARVFRLLSNLWQGPHEASAASWILHWADSNHKPIESHGSCSSARLPSHSNDRSRIFVPRDILDVTREHIAWHVWRSIW